MFGSDPAQEQLALPLGDTLERASKQLEPLREVSADAVDGLHRRLAELLARPLDVVATNNRRSLVSWRIVDGLLRLRIQRQFALADDDVIRAVARFVDARDPEARAVVQDYASTFQERIPKGRPVFTPPAGRNHDLRTYMRDQNGRFFKGRFRGRIGWSRAPHRSVRRKIRLGSWSPEHRLIRIHPVLDSEDVPGWLIAFVVFHEMLHAQLGVDTSSGRRRFHTDEFRRREEGHPDHGRAEAWIDQHTDELLSW